jgi:hypothetical protein
VRRQRRATGPRRRRYPDALPPIEYPQHFAVREITAAGTFRFKARLLFLSNALRHYPVGLVGLEEVADGVWSVYFCHVLLAWIDERAGILNRGSECYLCSGLFCYGCSRLLRTVVVATRWATHGRSL